MGLNPDYLLKSFLLSYKTELENRINYMQIYSTYNIGLWIPWILNLFELQEDRNEMANEIKILDDRHQRNHEDLDNRRDSDAQFNKTAILKLGEYIFLIFVAILLCWVLWVRINYCGQMNKPDQPDPSFLIQRTNPTRLDPNLDPWGAQPDPKIGFNLGSFGCI